MQLSARAVGDNLSIVQIITRPGSREGLVPVLDSRERREALSLGGWLVLERPVPSLIPGSG